MRKVGVFLIAAALLITGCTPANKFVGTWEGHLIMPPELINMMKQIAPEGKKDQFDDLSLTLELNDDNTYKIHVAAQDASATGTWSVSEDEKTLSLTPPEPVDPESDSFMASARDRNNIDFVISEDVKSISFEEIENGMTIGMEFSKK